MTANDSNISAVTCFYLLRGPLALTRLNLRDDGMPTCWMKKPDRRGNAVLVLTPMQLLARLCSLVPVGGIPVRKYFGVLCGSAKERHAIVPSPTRRKCGHRDKATPVQRPVKWAELLKRVWGLDALACVKCSGRMRAMAIIEDAAEVKRFLAHRGKSAVFERARGPPELAA